MHHRHCSMDLRTVGMISQPISPTAYWALVTRPDRGRPTLHGWWTPVALRYIKWWGTAAHSTRFTVSHSAPPTNPKPDLEEGAQPATGSRHRHHRRPHCTTTASSDFTNSSPTIAARAQSFTDRTRWPDPPRRRPPMVCTLPSTLLSLSLCSTVH